MKWMQNLLASAALLLAGSTQAASYTPESGFWWNPDEPGTGLAIEIEDDFIYVAAYLYDTQGFPYWYIGDGTLVENGSGVLSFTDSQVTSATGGQCLGCVWRAPTIFPTGGSMSISFDPADETRATLTWGGQVKTIRRLDYYDIGFGPTAENQRLLGEWQVILDFFNVGGNYTSYPFVGDILIMDAIDRAPNPDLSIGCRPRNSLAAHCEASDDAIHDVAAFYNSNDKRSYITVRDASNIYFTYVVYVGVHQFDGVVQAHAGGQFSNNGTFYPVRGFRSASRAMVQTGRGPASIDKSAASVGERSMMQHILTSNGGVMPKGMTAAEVKAQFGIDVTDAAATVNANTLRMEAKRQAAGN